MRDRITSAHVLALIAIVLAVGGNAFAFSLGKNSVGAKQLKKNAVTTAKLKKEAVTAAKVKKATLTGTQINASTLGTVPNATHAGNADTASSLPPPEPWHAIGGPGEPTFLHSCHNAGFLNAPTVSFYKDQVGVVHLEGIYNGCSPTGQNAFQLPPGYRPTPNLSFSLPLFGESVVVVHGSAPGIPASEVGAVDCPASLCTLNGITFRAES